MKNFWGYAHNERFGVGCTGQSVYIYDTEGRELKRFSGLRYAYTPLLCPGKLDGALVPGLPVFS